MLVIANNAYLKTIVNKLVNICFEFEFGSNSTQKSTFWSENYPLLITAIFRPYHNPMWEYSHTSPHDKARLLWVAQPISDRL